MSQFDAGPLMEPLVEGTINGAEMVRKKLIE